MANPVAKAQPIPPYLRARGIGEEKARAMMVQAFAFDVTSRFENEVIRDYVNHQIEENF